MYIINTPGRKKWLVAADTEVALPTNTVSHGGVQMKIRTFCSEPQLLSATVSCLQCNTLDNTLNCYTYMKRPILHIKAAPEAIRERLSNKSIFTTFPLLWVTHENKGLNLIHHWTEQGKRDIYYLLFSALPIFTTISFQLDSSSGYVNG